MKINSISFRRALGWYMVVFASILTLVALICPPLGIIDNSVLIAIAEFLGFCGGLLGIYFKFSWRDKEILIRNYTDKELNLDKEED